MRRGFLASIESIVGSRTLSRDVWLHRRPQSPSAVPRSGSASVYTVEIYHDIDGNPTRIDVEKMGVLLERFYRVKEQAADVGS